MNCNNCKDNYLNKIFKKCMKESDLYTEVLDKFDRIVLKSGDPRSSLTVFCALHTNTCDECKKYSKYYKSYLNDNESE